MGNVGQARETLSMSLLTELVRVLDCRSCKDFAPTELIMCCV